MTFYRRNLPHWHPDSKAIFPTWRLYGSLPKGHGSTATPGCAGRDTKKAPARVPVPPCRGAEFVRQDRLLDKAETGPLWLKDPRIARQMVNALRRGGMELRQYDLYSFVVMANHVHVLLRPLVPPRRITNGIKGVTARAANQILGQTGQPFWREESFDHWVRNDGEFERVRSYIERNPVTAGLAEKPEQWPCSSAARNSFARQ